MTIHNDSKIFRAWEDFNKVSIKKIPNAETFQNLISLSPKVRKWYADWSFDNSAFSQMPGSFKEHGITTEKWSKIAEVLPEINKVRKASSDEIEVKALEFQRFVELKENEAKAKLEKLEEPLIKILKVNITCLSLDAQLEILSKPEDERDELLKSKLELLRKKLLIDLDNGDFQDPFVLGDFREFLA